MTIQEDNDPISNLCCVHSSSQRRQQKCDVIFLGRPGRHKQCIACKRTLTPESKRHTNVSEARPWRHQLAACSRAQKLGLNPEWLPRKCNRKLPKGMPQHVIPRNSEVRPLDHTALHSQQREIAHQRCGWGHCFRGIAPPAHSRRPGQLEPKEHPMFET